MQLSKFLTVLPMLQCQKKNVAMSKKNVAMSKKMLQFQNKNVAGIQGAQCQSPASPGKKILLQLQV